MRAVVTQDTQLHIPPATIPVWNARSPSFEILSLELWPFQRRQPRQRTCIMQYQLGTHGLPLLKYLAWSCDHSSSESQDRGLACKHRPYHGTSSHLLSHASRISADFGGYIRHYVLFSAAAVGPCCRPHGFYPITCWPMRPKTLLVCGNDLKIINNEPVHARYVGAHLNNKLNCRTRIQKKEAQLKLRCWEMH